MTVGGERRQKAISHVVSSFSHQVGSVFKIKGLHYHIYNNNNNNNKATQREREISIRFRVQCLTNTVYANTVQ